MSVSDSVPGDWDSGEFRSQEPGPRANSVPGNLAPGVSFVRGNPGPSASSVPRNPVRVQCPGTRNPWVHTDLPQNGRKISTKQSNGLRNAQKWIIKWVPFSMNGNTDAPIYWFLMDPSGSWWILMNLERSYNRSWWVIQWILGSKDPGSAFPPCTKDYEYLTKKWTMFGCSRNLIFLSWNE